MNKLCSLSKLQNFNCLVIVRGLSSVVNLSNVPKKTTLLAESLHNRSLLRLHGKDVLNILQQLVTNDVTKLRKGFQSVYAMFLRRNGKVLADSIIYGTADKNTFLLECDRSLRNELKRRIRMLREREMELDIESLNGDFKVWAIFNDMNLGKTYDPLSFAHYKNGGSVGLKMKPDVSRVKADDVNEEILMCRDPRMKSLGARVVVPQEFNMKDVGRLFPHCLLNATDSNNDYRKMRYNLGVGEGVDDHIPGKLLPVESNCDFMNGFCFKKNGFVGRDVTSQSYHINIRRRIMPLTINGRLDFNNLNVHLPNGKHIGKLIGRKGKYGLAILRVEDALKALRLMVDGVPCEMKKPHWWPANTQALKRDNFKTQEDLARERVKHAFVN